MSEPCAVAASALLKMSARRRVAGVARRRVLSTNLHESTRIGIRVHSCPFVDKVPSGGEETLRLPGPRQSIGVRLPTREKMCYNTPT